MESKQAEEILRKYNAGTASAEEKAWVEGWYTHLSQYPGSLSEAELQQAQAESWMHFETAYRKSKTVKLWPKIAITAAAAAAIAIVFGIWFLNADRGTVNDGAKSVTVNDVVPGRNTAVITLMDGTMIPLSAAKTGVVVGDDLKYDDGSAIDHASLAKGTSQQGKEKMLTASTPRGGTYQVVLPDGTHVWLNADSKISFPVQFLGGLRKIFLSGEAYFEVAKDKSRPFIVQSYKQQVQVLGTHFNISAYESDGVITTTLLEGSVKVMPEEKFEAVLLKPGKQAVVDNSGIKVNDADLELAVAWKNGRIIFKDAEIQTIMKEVARWYDLEVTYVGEIPKDLFTGGISRRSNLSKLLKMFELNKIKCRIETIPGKTTKKLIIQQ